MRLALVGYGNVGKAFASLLERMRSAYPFRITAIHTQRQGTVYNVKGLPLAPVFGPAAESVAAFLDEARPDVMVEITTLNPQTGEPAISHIREAIERNIHVITANKGPIAFAFESLREAAKQRQVEFRFESTVMDGAPVFNTVRNNLPGVTISGFTGVLNSTTKVVVEAMREGCSLEQGVRRAQERGISEADASYDIDGWDLAAKAAALANVLMDARTTPREVHRKGIRALTTEQVVALARENKTLVLVSRGHRLEDGSVHLQVGPEILAETDLLATAKGTSNLILLHTDLMGTVGTISIEPGVEQTAYGLFQDLVDIARCL